MDDGARILEPTSTALTHEHSMAVSVSRAIITCGGALDIRMRNEKEEQAENRRESVRSHEMNVSRPCFRDCAGTAEACASIGIPGPIHGDKPIL